MADSVLYFVRRESDGAVKIGITTDLRRRLPDLRRLHGGMTLLGTAKGATTREKLLHLLFADARLDGEFFQATPAVMSFLEQYAIPPPQRDARPRAGTPRASRNRPWIDLYSDPLVVYERDQFVRDYASWIEQGLVSSEKRATLEIFRLFPEKIVFMPQPGLGGWGWTPLNPRCWTDPSGRRLYER